MYLNDNNGIYPGESWPSSLAPYFGITSTVDTEIKAAMGNHLRCPTHHRRIKELHPGISATDLNRPDYGINFLTGKFLWVPDERRNLKIREPSKVMLATECGFNWGGAVNRLDTYWLGGLPAAQGGSYTTGGVHSGWNNILFADGHVEAVIIAPKENPTRYTSQDPWDPIWGQSNLMP